MDTPYVIENDSLRLRFDARGRLAGFYAHHLGREWCSQRCEPGNWKIAVLSSGYPVDYVLGRDQQPGRVEQGPGWIRFEYSRLQLHGQPLAVGVTFTASLVEDEARFSLRIRNDCPRRIREAWLPVLAGFEGYEEDGARGVVHLARAGRLAQDVLRRGLPGAEYMFCVEGELAEFRCRPGFESMPWLDLYGGGQGLSLAVLDSDPNLNVLRIEKYPPELGTEFRGGDERVYFPAGVPRWLSLMAGQLTAIDEGETWQSPEVALWPHRGGWHAAASRYRAWVNQWLRPAALPAGWNHTGWLHLVGKTYLGQVCHDFNAMGSAALAAQQQAGLSGLLVSGHSEWGLWSADASLAPAPSLGGAQGFSQLCALLHQHGMQVVVSTFRHSAAAVDRPPEFDPYRGWAILDRLGQPRTEVWAMGSLEAAAGYEATAPLWTRICPSCLPWWQSFLQELRALADLGCDGACLQTFGQEGGVCYSPDHGHKPGVWMAPVLRERLAWLSAELRRSHPAFVLTASDFADWGGQYFCLSHERQVDEDGWRVFAFTFPEIKRQVVVDTQPQRQAAQAFWMGRGWVLEIDGGRRGITAAAPWVSMMRRLAGFRRQHAPYLQELIDLGPFKAAGEAQAAVYQGPGGYAVILWNPSTQAAACRVEGLPAAYTAWRLDGSEPPGTLPAEFVVEGGGILVLLVERLEER